jgi:hypothetical protein
LLFLQRVAGMDLDLAVGHRFQQPAPGRLQRVLAPAHDQHRRAVAQQQSGAVAADAARAAGDEGGLARQSIIPAHFPASLLIFLTISRSS